MPTMIRNFMRRLCCLIWYLGLGFSAAMAQEFITGQVTDEGNNPLEGVSISVKGAETSTSTDAKGQYALQAKQGDILVFGYVGYAPQEVTVADKPTVNVRLLATQEALDEVVVVGYGTMKKSDLTGSISTVKGEDLAERGFVKVSQALQGTIPGLSVSRSGGTASDASASIRIRGITTIGDSNPLIIVDGIPNSTLDWVNPNDIESISVLKDAASAAIYGSRAASGVILVTTKRGKQGQVRLSYDYSYTIEQPTRIAKYANAVDYMKVHNELSWNDNNNAPGANFPIYSEDRISDYWNLHMESPDRYPNTDWTSLLLNKTANRSRHMFNVTAGSELVKTAIAISLDETGALYNNRSYDRLTLRANNDISINKYLSATLDLNVLYSKNQNPVINITPGPLAAPIYAAIWQDGRIGEGKTGSNPYASLNYGGNDESKSNVYGGRAVINFTPIEDLKFSAVFNAGLFNSNGKIFRKKLTYTDYADPLNTVGVIEGAETTRLNEARENSLSITTQFLADYSKTLERHRFNLMAGYEEYYTHNEWLGASRDRYNLLNFPYLSQGNANYQFNNGGASEYANRSYFGRLTYSFDDKYLFQSNIRYDGSSRFHKDSRWGLFPSLSAGWVISKESFFNDDNSLMNFLKLRASWGALGNERIGDYPYQSTIGFGSSVLFQGDNVVAAQTAAVTDYRIQDISWETTETYNIGIDIAMVRNRLSFTGDIYKKTTRDMLLALAIPDFIGMNNPQQNTGNMYTKGWEVAIGWSDQAGSLRYSVTANLSDFRSVMGNLGGTQFLGGKVKFEGSEFDEWYGYLSDGLFQTTQEVANSPVLNANVRPGDVKYLDVSGPDGVPDGKVSPEYDRTLLGGSLPRYLYGGGVNLDYRNFSLGLVFQGIGRQNVMKTTRMIAPLDAFWKEVPEIILGNYWSAYNTEEENLNAIYPRVSTTSGTNNYATSDYWMFNGGYFRLSNVNFSYKLSDNIAEQLKLKGVTFNANVSDVFSIDRFPKGWDPEATGNYWITRAFSCGVSVRF